MGKIWFPPSGGVTNELIIPVEFVYGEMLEIGFNNTCYFTASNQHTFMPILPTGNFVAGTSLGPYFAAPEDSTVILTSFDEGTRLTYQYKVSVVPPVRPDPDENSSA